MKRTQEFENFSELTKRLLSVSKNGDRQEAQEMDEAEGPEAQA